MSFAQIMQLPTSKVDEIRAAADEWEVATEGKRTSQRSVCQDRNEPGSHFVIVFFDS
jgi:hypothetical protein